MKHNKSLFIASAVCSALTMAAANAVETKGGHYDAEKKHCHGAALKGQNDCAGEAHSCKGQAKEDCNPKDWKMAMSKEECDKMIAKACPAKK